MKKTLTTLLILTLVASVCGVMFASASDPVEELKTELEALVGAEANADFEWAMDVTTNEDGTVTVVLTVEGIEGKAVNYVYGDLYYNEDELILLTGKNQLGGVDCLTSAPVGFDNLTVMKPGVKGAIELNICNPENHTPLKDGDLVLTLTFKLAKGVTLAGLYIPTASVEGAANVDAVTEFLDLNGNGAYGIAYLEVKEESSEPTDPSDETSVPGGTSEETSVPGESSTTPSTPDDSSEETSVPGESSTTPSVPDDSSEEPDESSTTPSEPDDSSEEPDESSTTPSEPDDSSEEPDESSTTPSEPDDSSEEPDESSTTPSEPDDSSEEPDESSTTPSEPDDSSEEPDESSTTPSEPDDSSEETSEPDESSTTPSEPDDSSEETSDPAESSTTPAESSTTPAESSAASSETSGDGPGDSGVLLFLVLGLLAVAGAAVAIKVRG